MIIITPREALAVLRDFGWTWQEVAQETGFAKSTISRVANGRQAPRRELSKSIFALLEKEAKEIYALRDRLIAITKEAA